MLRRLLEVAAMKVFGLTLLAVYLPLALASSLGLKGHKEVAEHVAVEPPLHQQERCHQVSML